MTQEKISLGKNIIGNNIIRKKSLIGNNITWKECHQEGLSQEKKSDRK